VVASENLNNGANVAPSVTDSKSARDRSVNHVTSFVSGISWESVCSVISVNVLS
jgi:hypothetical protein